MKAGTIYFKDWFIIIICKEGGRREIKILLSFSSRWGTYLSSLGMTLSLSPQTPQWNVKILIFLRSECPEECLLERPKPMAFHWDAPRDNQERPLYHLSQLGCGTNCHGLGGSETTEIYFSELWSLEIWIKGSHDWILVLRTLFHTAECWLLASLRGRKHRDSNPI